MQNCSLIRKVDGVSGSTRPALSYASPIRVSEKPVSGQVDMTRTLQEKSPRTPFPGNCRTDSGLTLLQMGSDKEARS